MSLARRSPIAVPLGVASRYLLVSLLIVSGSLNIVLAHKLTGARTRNDSLVAIGTRVPPLSGLTSAGEASLVFPSKLPVLLYYFSPSCTWCKRNWNNLKALAVAAHGRYRLVAISTVESVNGELEALVPGVEVVCCAPEPLGQPDCGDEKPGYCMTACIPTQES